MILLMICRMTPMAQWNRSTNVYVRGKSGLRQRVARMGASRKAQSRVDT
jgi:hypothetical protein